MIAASAGQTPRNRKQAHNTNQHKHVGTMSLGDRSLDILGSLLSMGNDEKLQGVPNNSGGYTQPLPKVSQVIFRFGWDQLGFPEW